jgi:hypothetical protein
MCKLQRCWTDLKRPIESRRTEMLVTDGDDGAAVQDVRQVESIFARSKIGRGHGPVDAEASDAAVGDLEEHEVGDGLCWPV